jgi:hypothetical protein
MSGSAPTVIALLPASSARVLVSNSTTWPGLRRSVASSKASAAMPPWIATLLRLPQARVSMKLTRLPSATLSTSMPPGPETHSVRLALSNETISDWKLPPCVCVQDRRTPSSSEVACAATGSRAASVAAAARETRRGMAASSGLRRSRCCAPVVTVA